MKKATLLALAVLALGSLVAFNLAKTQELTARRSGNYNPDSPEGQFDLRVRVDGAVTVSVRGTEISYEVFNGRPPRDAGSEYSQPIPQAEVSSFDIDKRDGRGSVTLVEGPSPDNNYTARINIDDPRGGDDRYHVQIRWRTARPGTNPGVTAASIPTASDGPPAGAAQTRLSGSITVDAGRVIKPVSRGLFGTNVTWIHDAEGLWDSRRNGFNPEVLAMARELGNGPIRFPGGIFSDFYRWRDGVGPRNSRPERSHGSDEGRSKHVFGTDELMALTRETGGEPLMTVNIHTGTAREAADWVAYANRPNNAERARNGSREPYGIRYWEVGNEPYLIAYNKAQEDAQMSARDYADLFVEYARAMKQVDPSIRVMAVGGHNFGRYKLMHDDNWTRPLLERAGSSMDFLAVHNAYSPVLIRNESFEEVYRGMLSFPEQVRQDLEALNRDIERYAPQSADRIKLAITEWGPFWAPREDEHFLDHPKTLGSALFVASMMQVFLTAERLEIANFFKFTDYMSFLGMVGRGDVRKPTYWALQMYSRYFGDLLLETSAAGPRYELSKPVGGVDAQNNLPYLVAVSSLSEDRSKMYIVAVNKHFTDSIRTTIRIQGFESESAATLRVLTAPSLDANNGPQLPRIPGLNWPRQTKAPRNSMFDQGRPGTVAIQTSTLDGVSEEFELVIPSKAVVALEMTKR